VATDDDVLARGIVAAARDAVRRDKKRQATAARRQKARAQTGRMVGYVRVSTEDQGELGVGLDAQRDAIRAACAARKWHLVVIHQDVASGKELTKRPGLAAAMAVIHGGEASGLVVAKLDRLSRSVVDAALTIERAKHEGWNLVALDLGVDFSTAAGEAMANMTAVFAQLERRLIGERTRAALAVKKSQGVRLGRPPLLSAAVRKRITRERAVGAGWTAIAAGLNNDGVPTAHGGVRWYPSTVREVVSVAAPDLLTKRRQKAARRRSSR
jgi:DNA invertase Pin-like site-specific DNA recombinase